MIPYGRQDIQPEDIRTVVEVLQSDFLTQGPVVPSFEKTVADYCSSDYAVATNSATSALHLACRALGLTNGDYLWTSPITFVASANCGLYCGARVDFVDIDPRTYNLCPTALEEKLIEAEKIGCLPKVVVPVHLAGHSCDMRAIHALGQKFGFYIIEDASHAIGGKYQEEIIGNCRYSDITVFSFHPVKVITTGEGGMALTRNSELADKMRLLRSHGITRDAAQMTHAPDGPWYYQQIDLGYNYRMTDMQAALGISQMKRLDKYVARRQCLARRYNQMLNGLSLITPTQSPDAYSALHLYIIRLHIEKLEVTHPQVFESLRRQGIGVNLHYIPVHLQPYYKDMGFGPGDYPEAEKYYAEAISLPMYATLTETQQDEVVTAVKKALLE